MADLAPGTLVAGRYRLEHLLGEGGMGAVWAATHEITGGRVALKFLKAAGDPKSDARRRFLREARAATLVDHPNVVQIRDVVDFEDTPVLVMDLLVGETLATRLSRHGSFDLGDAARIGLQIVSAVGAAHEAGLIHRDLKPENVFLSRVTGNGEIVRVLDFGIAKLVGQSTDEIAVTQSGALIGTPAYMAPEQVFGERELDHRVDIWAIGVLLHEMLTGYRPVEGENYGQIAKKLLSGPIVSVATRRPDLPEDVIDLVDHMLARERTNRLADLRDAVDVLAKYSHAKRPSFGPPRAPRITQDSGPKIEPELRQVDPGAPTENVSSKERVSIPQELLDSQRRAPSDTLVAGSTPRPSSSPRSRQDTAEAHVTATRNSVGPARPTMLAVGVIGGLLLLGAIGLGVRSLTTSHSATPAAPSASTSPLSVPTVQPVPAVPSVVPSTTAEPAPTVTASAKPTASAEPTTKPTAAWVKPVKSAVSASAAITAPPAPTPAPPPTTTSTGGLVTKPPF